MGIQGLQGDVFGAGGDPKTLSWGKLRSQGTGLGPWKGRGVRYRAGERNCGVGTWECKGGAWWGQKNGARRGQKRQD